MERLTKDDAKQMGMVDLAHNHVFVKNHEAWYRDFETDTPVRDFIRGMRARNGIKCPADNEEFDEYMFDLLQDGYETLDGMIAMYYNTLWGFAEVREALKKYEDLEAEGRLIKLPCKAYSKVYEIYTEYDEKNDRYIKGIEELLLLRFGKNQYNDYAVVKGEDGEDFIALSQFDKTVFLTREEAEKALKGAKNEQRN